MIARYKRCRHLMLIPVPRAMPVFYSVLSALNQKQPGEMGKGNHDVSLSTCVPAGYAAWCCVVPLLQQQYRGCSSRTKGVPLLPVCPSCSTGILWQIPWLQLAAGVAQGQMCTRCKCITLTPVLLAEALPAWVSGISEWAGSGMQEDISISGFM